MNIKLSVFAALSAALSLTACSSEEASYGAQEEVLVPFTVSLPADMQTRATYGDGSHATINQIAYSVFKVIDGSDEPKFLYSSTVNETVTDVNSIINISVPLLKNFKYRVTFFAKNSANSKVTYKDGNMTVNYQSVAPNDINADVFTGVSTEIEVTGAAMTDYHEIALKRPLAQLNWGTTGIEAMGDALSSLTADVSISGGLFTTYNVLTGAVSGEVETAVNFTSVSCNALPEVDFPVSVEGKDLKLVAMNYILVGKNEETDTGTIDCSITFNWTEGGEAQTRTSEANSVPCMANCRTNIYGDLITTPGVFKCTINRSFNNEEGDDNNITDDQLEFKTGSENDTPEPGE